MLVLIFRNSKLNNQIPELQEQAACAVYEDNISSFDELLDIGNSKTVHSRKVVFDY